MKKILALALALVMTMTMAACGSNTPAETPATSTPASNTPATSTPAAPQEDPNDFLDWKYKTTEILVPLAAGGGTDLAARVLAQALSEATGKNFVITNNTNGSGAEVYNSLADANDCSTISFTLGSYFSGYWTGIHDCAPNEAIVPASVLQLGKTTPFFVVRADAKWNTFEELLADMKANPGTISFGIPTGGINYFQGYELQQSIDFNCRFVDAAGDSEKVTGILGGTIDVATVNAKQAGQYVEAGQMKPLIALQSFDKTLIPECLADVPSFEDNGYPLPKCLVNTYYVLASSNADSDEVAQLNELVQYVMSQDSTIEAFNKISQYPEAYDLAKGQENFDASSKSYHDVSVAAGIIAANRK